MKKRKNQSRKIDNIFSAKLNVYLLYMQKESRCRYQAVFNSWKLYILKIINVFSFFRLTVRFDKCDSDCSAILCLNCIPNSMIHNVPFFVCSLFINQSRSQIIYCSLVLLKEDSFPELHTSLNVYVCVHACLCYVRAVLLTN